MQSTALRPASHTSTRGYSVADMRDLILGMSEERAIWAERERSAYRRGWQDGAASTGEYERGWTDAETAAEAEFRSWADPIAHPERGMHRRLQAAVRGERMDAADHWETFTRRAYNTHPSTRTDAQVATCRTIGPPEGPARRPTRSGWSRS